MATVRFYETIQILFPECHCLRVMTECAKFGETYKKKFLLLSAMRDNFSQFYSRVKVYNPILGSKTQSLVPIRIMANFQTPLNVNSNDDNLNLNSSNGNANSNYGVGASVGTSLVKNKLFPGGRVYLFLAFFIHPPSILPISSRCDCKLKYFF